MQIREQKQLVKLQEINPGAPYELISTETSELIELGVNNLAERS